jgi:tetratricopeptide (TPR) repeat protein
MFNDIFNDIFKGLFDQEYINLTNKEMYEILSENKPLAQSLYFPDTNKYWPQLDIVHKAAIIDTLKATATSDDLVGILNMMIKKKDKKLLQKEVDELNYHIIRVNTPQAYKTHAIACFHCENYSLGVQSLKKAGKDSPIIDELLGIVYYSVKNYSGAAAYFKDVKNMSKPGTTTLLSAVSNYQIKFSDAKSCQEELKPILDTSSLANNFLGIAYFNEESYSRSVDFFTNEVALTKGRPESKLNLLKATYALDKKSAISQFGEFLYSMQITPEKLLETVKEEKITVPHYKVNLVKITEELLAK